MNTILRYLMVLGFGLATIIRVHSQGYILPNGVTYSTAGLGAVIHIAQNPANTDLTGFNLRPWGTTPGDAFYTIFTFGPATRDKGVRTFLAFPNDPISLQAIQANSYTELEVGIHYGFKPDVPFFLGFYTGYTNGTPAGIYSNPVFGWGKFVTGE